MQNTKQPCGILNVDDFLQKADKTYTVYYKYQDGCVFVQTRISLDKKKQMFHNYTYCNMFQRYQHHFAKYIYVS